MEGPVYIRINFQDHKYLVEIDPIVGLLVSCLAAFCQVHAVEAGIWTTAELFLGATVAQQRDGLLLIGVACVDTFHDFFYQHIHVKI
ncbi:hypothetical protein HG531_004460 [Fusarium graminearum]|nr:hypothetical protein HG531_004460 [Fusarium graminearum]